MELEAKTIFFTRNMHELQEAYMQYRWKQHAEAVDNDPTQSPIQDNRELYLDFLGVVNELLSFGWELGRRSTTDTVNPYEVEREDRGVMDAPGVMQEYLTQQA